MYRLGLPMSDQRTTIHLLKKTTLNDSNFHLQAACARNPSYTRSKSYSASVWGKSVNAWQVKTE